LVINKKLPRVETPGRCPVKPTKQGFYNSIVVVVVVHSPPITISVKSVQRSLTDTTLMIVVPFGTKDVVYPAKRAALETPVSNADTNPSTSE